MTSQDGIASIPDWFRRFLLWLYGYRIVEILDWIGGLHDQDISRYGYILAALIMAGRLFFYLPWILIALPVSVIVIIYAIAPRILKDQIYKLTQ